MPNAAARSLLTILALAIPRAALAAAPTATTSAASSITTSSAVLNGSGTPGGEQTTGWFRISPTNPGVCDDVFGTRVPAASGTDLGAGGVAVPYSITTTGLVSGITYYFCAVVANASGNAFGPVLSFTVPGAPVTVTASATSVTGSSATLNGSVNPGAATTTGWFRYSTTSPGSCNDTFGTRAPASGGSALGSGTSSVDYTRAITGLIPGTPYYFCAIGANAYGTTFGGVLSFTTLANPPVVTTNSASTLTGSGASLNGSANPGGAATTGWFRYGTASPGTCNDSFGTRAPAVGGSGVGAGTFSVTYSQVLSGLSPGTTYYYCAIAQNSVGASFGAVVSFTTPLPPSATTSAASSITNTSAYLNGAAAPNASSTTGYFRYGTTNPGACNDTFGSRAPVSGGTSLGSGNILVSYSQYVTGLSQGATYYYCAIAQSAEGTSFGNVLSFTTAGLPAVTTSAATLVTASSATLNGSSVPNLDSSYGYFRYSTANPGVCNDTFGSRVPASSFSDSYLGAGSTGVAFSYALGGLTPGTTYYFCAVARNAYGTSFGTVLSSTTPAAAPVVTTNSANGVTATTATLNGTVNPGGAATTGWFRYGTASPGSCNDSFGTRAPAVGGSGVGAGTFSVTYSQVLSGLSPGTTYYYCAIAQSSVGLSVGSVLAFTTPAPPSVSTVAATPVTATTATLNAAVNPNGFSTTGWFRYATTDPGACDASFGAALALQSLGSGMSPIALASAMTGLSPATTYYFCAIAQSSIGTSFGAVFSFTTPAAPPTVTTVAATGVADTVAQLNGTANPNGAATTGWFRYSITNPGTCNDVFGTRGPASGGTSLGAGSAASPYNITMTGLSPATTYYFCAIAQSSIGTSFGAVLSATTLAAPTVTTVAATGVADTVAQLNGTANPNGAATTGWYRYSITNPGTCNDAFGTRAPAIGGTSLGAGSAPVAFSLAVAGLTPGTTYYYCAIAANSVGTSFGAVLSATTLAAPTVTTVAATGVADTVAQLNGSANPNGAPTTGWFRYSITDPGTCNDAFGTRGPAIGGTSLGAGSGTGSFTLGITGLTPGTTYHYCAIASNSVGASFGPVLSFTTSAAPSVATLDAADLTSTSAMLVGAANPHLAETTGWFRWDSADPGACDDSFGLRVPDVGGASLGAGGVTAGFAEPLAGLVPGATYYYCAIAQNAVGLTFGAVVSFTTPAAPTVTTLAASSVGSATATLEGEANPNRDAATGWFRYSWIDPGTCDDEFGFRVPFLPTTGTDLGGGTDPVPYSEPLAGLVPGDTYYYCAIAANASGTSFGAVRSFTMEAAPNVTTLAATGVGSTGATVRASVTPNRADTSAWFRYDTANPGTCSETFGAATAPAALGADSAPVAVAAPLIGLAPLTTYFYCAIASNSVGTTLGDVLSFTTPAPPAVTTVAATGVASTSVTLRASATPNGAEATGWFRYSSGNPGTCDDAFGTRAPVAGGASLGAAILPASWSELLVGLAPGTTYYYCAIAQNAEGTSFGAVVSFTTPAAPSVMTLAATDMTSTGATLNGSATPNLDSTTAWFRIAASAPGSCDDTFGAMIGGSPLGSGSIPAPYTFTIFTGLQPGTTYWYCAVAENGSGTSFGALQSFTTSDAPAVTSAAATAIGSTTATLHAAAAPRLDATTGWFRYSTTSPGTCSDSFGTRAPATGGSFLGSGSSAVPYLQDVSALASGTTYYFCAIAQNTNGTSAGEVLSFTTLAAPTVTTAAATPVASTTATLGGSANPMRDPATGWFRYSTTSPGTCNDFFGARAPASGGADLGNGSADAAWAEPVTGLAPGTTYYYCAVAANSIATSFGAIQSFTTTAAPSVTTVAASATSTGATFSGSANPMGEDATGWFRYGMVSPGACSDAFGLRVPSSGGAFLGNGRSAVPFTEAVTGLTPGATYYFCAVSRNGAGTSVGAVMSFTTSASPAVTTAEASGLGGTSATLHGAATPRLAETTAWFRLDTVNPGACSDSFGTRTPLAGIALGSGTASVPFSENVTGLTAGTTYYYCAIASNAAGAAFGEVRTFNADRPVVTTAAAGAVTGASATLNGSAVPKLAATGWFRFDTVDPGTCSDAFGLRAPASGGSALGAGSAAAPYAQPISGLAPGTTYYYCALAANSAGASFGAVRSFTTLGSPIVVTSPPMLDPANDTSATLVGSANPNLSAAQGWFRWGNVDPGTCDDAYGTRLPATGGTDLGAGGAPVAFTETLTALSPGTTYWFCALAANSLGTAAGAPVRFTAGATPPTVATQPPTSVAATSATLEGTADAQGVVAGGWFRLSTMPPAGTCDDAFGDRLPGSGTLPLAAASGPQGFSASAAGLGPVTTYYYCAAAASAGGAVFGDVLSFTTSAAPPAVATQPAAVSGGSVTLGGTANPNGSPTVGWFRYATTSPGSCDDAFGTRAPGSGGTAVGAGTADAPFSQALSLAPGTYYGCALASNAGGTATGELTTFVVSGASASPPAGGGCGCGAAGGGPAGLALVAIALAWLRPRRRRSGA